MPFRVLFVCTGNTCRSPLAESILRRVVQQQGEEDILVGSAGTHSEPPGRASSGALEIARENDLDLESFHSRRLTPELLDETDLVLVMEPSHRSLVLGLHPVADTKTMLLGELSGLSGREAAVPDPFGGPMDSYRRTFQRLTTLIMDGLPRLLEIAARKAGRA